MSLIKKMLLFLRDILCGALFPGLAIGFMLLVASAMFYFRPQDYFTEHAVFPLPSQAGELLLASKLLKLGLLLVFSCSLLLWLRFKIEAWWKRRPKVEAVTPPSDTPA
jgi:hypothetical protein